MCSDRSERGRVRDAESSDSFDAFRLLSSPRRVAVLAALTGSDGPLSVSELARRVAAGERATTPDSVDEREVRRLAVSLRHAHLPALDSHSIVDWDRCESTVRLSDGVTPRRLPVNTHDPSGTAITRLLRTLSQPRRRLVLETLATRDGPLTVDELARDVAATETAQDPETVSGSTVDRIRISLVHSHLPALSAADVVSYDEETGRVDASWAAEDRS